MMKLIRLSEKYDVKSICHSYAGQLKVSDYITDYGEKLFSAYLDYVASF